MSWTKAKGLLLGVQRRWVPSWELWYSLVLTSQGQCRHRIHSFHFSSLSLLVSNHPCIHEVILYSYITHRYLYRLSRLVLRQVFLIEFDFLAHTCHLSVRWSTYWNYSPLHENTTQMTMIMLYQLMNNLVRYLYLFIIDFSF